MSVARMAAFDPSLVRMRYVPEDDPYPNIREYLAPEYANLAADDVEVLLEGEGIHAEAMEGFFNDVGRAFSSVAKAAAPVVTKALPGVISGAAAGCALGPWGCLGGALIGGVGSALSKGSKPGSGGGSSPVSAIAGAIPAIAGATGGGGGIASGIASALPAIAGLVGGGGESGAGKTNPAGILLGLIQRPEVQQALMSMALGGAGRKDISVGGNSVPASAVANLVSSLGSRAFAQAEAATEPSEDLPGYLYSNGKLAVDPAVPSERAARLLEMFGEVAMRPPRMVRAAFTEADEYYDELDMAELHSMEMEGNDLEFND